MPYSPGTDRMTKSSASLRQFSLILGLTVGVAACSTIADLDPTGLLDDGSDSASTSQFPDQAPPTAASDQDLGTTPDLASLPARPAPTATPGERQQAAQSLASDGAQARYSAEALRGGTEAAAAPPAPSDAAPNAAQRILGAAAPDAPPTATPPGAEAPPAASEEPPVASAPPPAAAPQVAAAPPPPQAAPPQAPAAGAQPAVPASAPVRTATLPGATATPVGPSAATMPARGEPAVPANTPARGGSTMVAAAPQSDAALGFKPSSAPPLDPSISKFVSAPIVARYRQTASLAGTPAIPAVPPKAGSGSNDAVVANLSPSGAARIAAINGGAAPTAVIYFPGDGTALSKAAHAQVRAAVAAFKANGGQGTVRVVGHASSRTANMSVEKHLETIFAKSQARANAVAQDLIRQGVPADKVMIDAVGDSQPIYYESMPKGEAGNRRAEIFVQG
jgi:outer membrane protein OmpA-like peptidoglycan-associated protein